MNIFTEEKESLPATPQNVQDRYACPNGSFHSWLPLAEDTWWHYRHDNNATNEAPYARFLPKDTLFANMQVIR